MLLAGNLSSNQMVANSNPFAERVQQSSVSAPGSDSEGTSFDSCQCSNALALFTNGHSNKKVTFCLTQLTVNMLCNRKLMVITHVMHDFATAKQK